MSTLTVPAAPAARDAVVRRFGRMSLFAALYTYLLILFGGTVRLTESGLGCGDDWPKCNGQWIPEFTLPTLIEYAHRVLGVTIGLVLLALAAYAFRHRDHPAFRGRNGLALPAFGVAALVVVQGLLGAVTVWFELPAAVIVIHFMTALLIFSLALLAAFKAGTLGEPHAPIAAARAARISRGASATAALGFAVIAFGALTANLPGAAQACQGFPHCNGSLLPAAVPAVYVQWTHRALAFLLLFHLLATVLRVADTRGAVRRAAVIALGFVVAQILVAAAMVLTFLPVQLRALHLAVGVAAWAALLSWALFARALATLSRSSA